MLSRAYVKNVKEFRTGSHPELKDHSTSILKRTLASLATESAKAQRVEDFKTTDAALSRAAWMTDSLQLGPYAPFFHLTPRLVNVRPPPHGHAAAAAAAAHGSAPSWQVVSLGEATPEPNTGTALPLNLRVVASKLTNAYYAPRRCRARAVLVGTRVLLTPMPASVSGLLLCRHGDTQTARSLATASAVTLCVLLLTAIVCRAEVESAAVS